MSEEKLTYTQEVRYLRKELSDLNDQFGDFIERYDSFVAKYDLDMRGDLNVKSGEGQIGIIGNIRWMKEQLRSYPSLLWLLAHRPLPTVAIIVSIFALLMVLWTIGVLPAVAQVAGANIDFIVTPTP